MDGLNDTGVIIAFKKKVAAWWAKVEELRAADVSGSPSLTKDKEKLLRWADRIKVTLEKIPFLDDLGLGEMAAVPLIPIALVLGVVGVIAKWTTDFVKWKLKYNEYRALKKAGASTQVAAKISQSLAGETNIFESLGTSGQKNCGSSCWRNRVNSISKNLKSGYEKMAKLKGKAKAEFLARMKKGRAAAKRKKPAKKKATKKAVKNVAKKKNRCFASTLRA